MLRPGSAIKRKQKPLPSQIAQKQVSNNRMRNIIEIARGEQTPGCCALLEEERLRGGFDHPRVR